MRRLLVVGLALLPLIAGDIDTARLARIPARMQQMVDRGEVAGTVVLVARHGNVALFEATGYQDLEARKPMRKDSIFQIMSMTKQFTGVGIMMLMEEGKLSLLDPVEKFVPAFKGQMVSEHITNFQSPSHPPARPITIRDLMTHTSGMWGPAEGDMLLQKMDRSLKDAVDGFAKLPLAFEPGTKWSYSNPGIATLGRIIEVVSDQPFDKFITDRILTPLGMTDSFFFPPADKKDRICAVYDRRNGKLVKVGDEALAGDPMKFRKGAIYPGPEYGLYSTAHDLSQFYQMMANHGTLNGRRLLSKTSVDVMTSVQTGDLKAGWLPGEGEGLTWEVVKDPIGTLTLLSKGTFNHGGAFGTHGWVDPSKDLVGVFLVQGGNVDEVKRSVFQMIGAAID